MSTSIVLGTTGSYKYEFQQFPGLDWKQFVLQYNNYSQDPVQSQPFIGSTNVINFPTGFFSIAPGIDCNTTGLTFTITPNSVSVPIPPYITVPQDQIVNGILVLEGF